MQIFYFFFVSWHGVPAAVPPPPPSTHVEMKRLRKGDLKHLVRAISTETLSSQVFAGDGSRSTSQILCCYSGFIFFHFQG